MISKVLFSSNKDDWTTPKDLFFKLDSEFHFDIDACASDENALCNEYYTKTCSILDHDFVNKSIFMNPPYGRDMYKFVKWCSEQQKK